MPAAHTGYSVLWRAVTVSPSGWPQVIEVRAPSEQMALDRLAHWKPFHTIQRIERRPTP